MRLDTKAFLTGIIVATLGALALLTGIGAAFGRAGNWADNLADIGIWLLVLGGSTLAGVTIFGLVVLIVQHRFRWWLPISLGLSAGGIWWGWAALHF